MKQRNAFGARSLTLASRETEAQFPVSRSRLPSPMRFRMTSGLSLGPLAKGAVLQKGKVRTIHDILPIQLQGENPLKDRDQANKLLIAIRHSLEILLFMAFIACTRKLSIRKLDLAGDVHEMGGKEVSRQIAAEIAHQSTDQID